LQQAGFLLQDNTVTLDSLQIVSNAGSGVGGLVSTGNWEIITNCIVDGGNPAAVEAAGISIDASSLVANNLIISRGWFGIYFKYAGTALWNTIVQPSGGGTGSVGIVTHAQWPPNIANTAIANNAIFGFQHGAGMENGNVTTQNPLDGHNITDAPIGDSGSTSNFGTLGSGATVVTIPNTTYGATAAAAFVSPGSDYRPKPRGTLINAGAAFGNFNQYCYDPPSCSATGGVYNNVDTPDMLKKTRPQSGNYDIGAIMH
jgi:hypothetical protein